jgi:nitrogen fixation protein NifU and related proteins
MPHPQVLEGAGLNSTESTLCVERHQNKELFVKPIMFSEAVLDHFKNPRNAGELPDADAIVEVSNPVCGDILKLAIRRESNRVVEARFLCRGCTTAIACASYLTEKLLALPIGDWKAVNADSISNALGDLPPATTHGAQLATDALRALERALLNR